jgi:hypothetical protein
MYLLVIGLVAVIVAFLVAAFFSMRRGHDDEDEPARRPSVRDRIRSRGGDSRDRDPRWDSGPRQRPAARRPAGRGPAPSRRPGRDSSDRGRGDRYDRAGYDQPRGYEPSDRGYGERAPIRGYDGQRAERTPSARRGARYDDATETVVQSAARPARSSKAAPSARTGGDDSFGTGPVTALYDTGPSAPAPADYPTGQVNADPDLADSDVFPRVREDIPRPASKARQRSQPKTRSGRPSRKHDDDDDWPSTEWDKLSDEQYWAELSADKPLATTARSAQSSSPAAAKPARGQAARPTATPRPDRDRGAAAAADRTDRRSSTGSGSRRSRDRAGQDDATQQLDARPASRSGSRPPAARPPGAQAAEAGDRDTRAAGSRPAGRSGRPAPAPEYEATERMPSRSRSRAAAEMPSSSIAASAASVGTGPMNAVPVNPGPVSTGPLGAPINTPINTGPASPAPRRPARRGPVGDDPLTSPAYARDTSPGGDTRSYRSSGRTAPRDQPRAAEEPRGYPRSPARGDYPDTSSRPGYPAAAGERTDPNASRPAASAGYLASPPPARSSYDDGRPAETTSPQAGAGNPYGSFVDSAAPPRPETTGPSYPPATPGTGSQGSYGTGPTSSYGGQAGYPDPYGPGRDGYPAAAGHGSQDQGGTYYSAPPAAPAQPAAAYPYPASSGGYQDSPGYQNGAGYPDSGRYQNGTSYQGATGYQDSTVYQNGGGYPESNDYPGSNGYSASNGQPGYGSRYTDDSQQNARYPGSPGTDPYGPDGYGGYHSRQG